MDLNRLNVQIVHSPSVDISKRGHYKIYRKLLKRLFYLSTDGKKGNISFMDGRKDAEEGAK